MEKPTTYKTSRKPDQTETDRLIPESQLREIVRSLIQTPKNQWYDTDPAYTLLGLSAKRLRIMVRDGTLRLGTEVRDIRLRASTKPHYQFNIEKCNSRLLELPEKRLGAQSLRSSKRFA